LRPLSPLYIVYLVIPRPKPAGPWR